MEEFYASISGALTTIGGLTVFFVLQRKDTRQLAKRLEDMILRESNRQEANTQKVADDLKEARTSLEGKIEKEANRQLGILREESNRLANGTQRVEDRLLTIDNRVRDVEGDMKVVMYRLRITDGHPVPPEPAPPRPAPSVPVPDNPERIRSIADPSAAEK